MSEWATDSITSESWACGVSGDHLWVAEGVRCCPKHETGMFLDCGQNVYYCPRCGEYDYGYPGGPAHDECFVECTNRDTNLKTPEKGQ